MTDLMERVMDVFEHYKQANAGVLKNRLKAAKKSVYKGKYSLRELSDYIQNNNLSKTEKQLWGIFGILGTYISSVEKIYNELVPKNSQLRLTKLNLTKCTLSVSYVTADAEEQS